MGNGANESLRLLNTLLINTIQLLLREHLYILDPNSVRHVPHTLLPFLVRHTCCKTHIIVESFELVLSLSYNTNIKA